MATTRNTRRSMMQLLLAALVPAVGSTAQVHQLPPSEDATADALAGTTGSQPEIRLGSQFLSIPWYIHLRGYFRFDLTPLAGLGVPVRASVHWYQAQVRESGPPRLVTAHRVTAAWSEGTLTYFNAPSNDAQALAAVHVGPGTPIGWKAWDITSLVQDWLAGAQPNFGVVLRHPDEQNFDLSTGVGPSRESPAPQRPYLEVDFGTTFGSGCTTAGSVPVLVFAGGSPALASSFTLRSIGLTTGALPAIVLGTDNTLWTGGALPFPLAAFGFPGCELLVAPESRAMFAPLSGPAFDVTLAVPNAAHLRGLPVFAQTAAFGAGLQMTNGFGLTVH
jgi:hypothetical protein